MQDKRRVESGLKPKRFYKDKKIDKKTRRGIGKA
jgi:hypothetical protein